MTVAEFVVGEAGLLRAKEESRPDLWSGEMVTNLRRCAAQNIDRMLKFALAKGGCAVHKACVGEGLVQRCKEACRRKDRGCIDSASGLLKRQWIVGDDAQVGKAKVDHGACNSTDVEHVAGANKDDRDTVQCRAA